ncbi:hypothetical protein BC332_34682 [Capsicum chinense]|nr:hypothetical protein BC332_34682 [Capsicum chinense]
MADAPTVLNMIINAPPSVQRPLPRTVHVMTEWNSLSPDEQAKIQARQRVNHIGLEEVDVKYPESMKSVLFDVKTNGRLVSKGDLSVKRLDGYMELNDRSKDIIISGGENISTSEVESVIFSHPTVLEAAVVGRPDDHWGETPCAFV